MKRTCNSQSGMSLLEVTFAAGIMATALSLLFGSLISISLIGRLNEDKSVAHTELASTMEQLRSLDFSDLMTFTPPTPTTPGVEQTLTLEAYFADGTTLALPLTPNILGEVTVPENLPNPLEIRATLLWQNEKGHIFQAHATTSVGR